MPSAAQSRHPLPASPIALTASRAARRPHVSPGGAADHGIGRVARLGDSVGYVAFTGFECSAAARNLARAALRRFAGARAIILDLRQHGGGEESAAAHITSHFFATESMAQERFAVAPPRNGDGAGVPRLLSATIDVLVSRETSALGRAFAANLERLGRARIVGPAPRRWAPRPAHRAGASDAPDARAG